MESVCFSVWKMESRVFTILKNPDKGDKVVWKVCALWLYAKSIKMYAHPEHY